VKTSSLHSAFAKYMISCVIVFDGCVNKVDYDDKHQWHRRTGRHFTGVAEKNCPENNNLS